MIIESSSAPRRRAVRGVVALAAVAAVTIGLTACTSRGPEGPSGESTGAPGGVTVSKFALVAPENESDFGWNQAGLAGAEKAAAELGIDVELIPDAGWDNAETVLTQVASDGAQFIIAHASGYGVAAAAVAASTGVPILVQDVGMSKPGQVAVTTVSAEQGGYLAGIAAAMTTTSKKVGLVLSADDTNWFKMSGGFIEGVRSVDPAIEVLYASVGPAAYADSAGGKAAAEQLIAAGVDVLFGMGDGATHGYLQAVEAASGVKYIADIGDVTPGLSNTNVLLTSVLWNYGPTYVQAIKDVEAGVFGTKDYNLSVTNGGLSLQETPNLTAEIKAAIDKARSAIESGTIVPTPAETADKVRAILDAG